MNTQMPIDTGELMGIAYVVFLAGLLGCLVAVFLYYGVDSLLEKIKTQRAKDLQAWLEEDWVFVTHIAFAATISGAVGLWGMLAFYQPTLRPNEWDLVNDPVHYIHYAKANESSIPVSVRARMVVALYNLRSEDATTMAREIAKGFVLTQQDQDILHAADGSVGGGPQQKAMPLDAENLKIAKAFLQ